MASDTQIGQNAAAGAAAGSAAGPYGAAIGAGAGVIGGLIGSGQDLPTIDLGALLSTINSAGQYQQQIINSLPAAIQKQLADYVQQNGAAGAAYQTGVTGTGNDLLAKTAALYGPNSDAANAEKLANKSAIYSTVPGTQDAVRGALAASGGLSRGHAGTALAQPYLQAASAYGQSAMATDAAQTKASQGATQQALSTVASMNDQMFTQLFGMSKAQAQQILTTGTQALQTQLTQLINQSQTQTNQALGVEGLAADNGYQNAVTRGAQQGQIWNGIAGLGLQGIQAGFNALGPGSTGLPVGSDVSSADYIRNANANAPV